MTFEVASADHGQRLDVFLSAKLPDFSRMRLKALVLDGSVQVDGRCARPSQHLKTGQQVLVAQLPELPAADAHLTPEPMELDVIYEDQDLWVINKPRGLVVHPAPGHRSGTLVNGLVALQPDLPGPALRPGLVHRLDRDTTGLLVVAKNLRSYGVLSEQMARREISRFYLALVHGSPPQARGLIRAPLARDPRNRQRYVVVSQRGRQAATHFQVLESFAQYSLLRLQLETGRTHQIRVHLKFLGVPVVGDPLYGPDPKASGQLLHAAELHLKHPADGRPLSFEAPLPPDFAAVLSQLREAPEVHL